MSHYASLVSVAAALLALTGSGCQGGDDGNSKPTREMATKTVAVVIDAGVPIIDARPPAASSLPDLDDYHLDPGTRPTWRPTRPKSAPQHIVHLILRSSPPGAMAHVDGVPIGVTPTYWEGPAHGKPRDFVFTLRGYAMARYRFVPITDGVVYGKLTKLAVVPPDAGAAAAPAAPAEKNPAR